MRWIFLIFMLIFGQAISKPQVLLRDNEEFVHKDFDSCEPPTILWEEDGECYPIGQRGPCSEAEILIFDRETYSPKCAQNTRILIKPETTSKRNEKLQDEKEKIEKEKSPSNSVCNSKGQIFWPEEKKCYPLLEQGPCQQNQWLVVEKSENSSIPNPKCVEMQCSDPDSQVFYPSVCQCVDIFNNISSGRYTPQDICGENYRFTWTPFGEGVCTCENGYLHDEDSDLCHKLGTQGPCKDGFVWSSEDGLPICIDGSNELEIRVLDLIPTDSRQTRIVKCYMDSKGKCRKTLGLNIQRFGDLEFVQWINSFTPSIKDCSLNSCAGDKLLWHDGECYQAASTGPCKTDEWLLLQNIIDKRPVLRCEPRRCKKNEAWMNCTCVDISQKIARLDISSGVCEEGNGWNILISPYGQGICSCKNSLKDDGVCTSQDEELDLSRIDFINTRRSQLPQDQEEQEELKEQEEHLLASRQNCQLKDNNCQKESVEGIDTVDDNVDSLENIIDWLNKFPKQDDSTCLKLNQDEGLSRFIVDSENLTNVDESEADCSKEGRVLFNGTCSKLLSSSSCDSPNQWLVFVENSTSLYLKCQEQPCQKSSKPFYVQDLCQCIEQNSTTWCSNGEKRYNSFGRTFCSCSTNQVFYPEDGECYTENEKGPCELNEILVKNSLTNEGVCQRKELSQNKEKDSCIFRDMKLGSVGPCPDGYLLLINQDTGKPKCKRTALPPFQYYHHTVSNKC